MKKITIVLISTFLVLAFVVIAGGGGHGTYLPAKVIFPYSMILALLSNQIGIIAIIIAVIQIPLYSFLINKKSKWIVIILGIHIISTIICLYIPSETFNG